MWWHAFINRGDCCGITTTLIAGLSAVHPEELLLKFDQRLVVTRMVPYRIAGAPKNPGSGSPTTL
jgi:hypothetical protein